jgi:hypothetical protein
MNATQSPNTAVPLPLRWRIRNWLFRELFATEYMQLHNYQRIADQALREATAAAEELDRLRRGRPARFIMDQASMGEEEIARRLAGTQQNPALQAVMALVDRKIVEMSDRATNPPSAENTADLRTYEAGGANAMTEFKTRLAGLTEPRPETAKAEAA